MPCEGGVPAKNSIDRKERLIQLDLEFRAVRVYTVSSAKTEKWKFRGNLSG
jgi:hypothetical protein